jgi:hypothetical protein
MEVKTLDLMAASLRFKSGQVVGAKGSVRRPVAAYNRLEESLV